MIRKIIMLKIKANENSNVTKTIKQLRDNNDKGND